MICTVILTFLVSVANGPYECRSKDLDVESAAHLTALMVGKDITAEEWRRSFKFTFKDIHMTVVPAFECGNRKEADDKRFGCSKESNKESRTAYASKN